MLSNLFFLLQHISTSRGRVRGSFLFVVPDNCTSSVTIFFCLFHRLYLDKMKCTKKTVQSSCFKEGGAVFKKSNKICTCTEKHTALSYDEILNKQYTHVIFVNYCEYGNYTTISGLQLHTIYI